MKRAKRGAGVPQKKERYTVCKSFEQEMEKDPTKRALGSRDYDFTNVLLNQTRWSIWMPEHMDEETRASFRAATTTALIGLSPSNEGEALIVSHIVACHMAAMECFKRAALDGQTLDSRNLNLKNASRMSRLVGELSITLQKLQGKAGQQKVVVEHVTVNAGGQAIVGSIEQNGGGYGKKSDEQIQTPRRPAGQPQRLEARPKIPVSNRDAKVDA